MMRRTSSPTSFVVIWSIANLLLCRSVRHCISATLPCQELHGQQLQSGLFQVESNVHLNLRFLFNAILDRQVRLSGVKGIAQTMLGLGICIFRSTVTIFVIPKLESPLLHQAGQQQGSSSCFIVHHHASCIRFLRLQPFPAQSPEVLLGGWALADVLRYLALLRTLQAFGVEVSNRYAICHEHPCHASFSP